MQKAAKLMIDKYCMYCPLLQGFDSMSYWPYVRDSGYMQIGPNPGQNYWEETWMEPH